MPHPAGKAGVAVLAFCATAGEAGVARDLGVIWREVRYGTGGDLAGQRYNYQYDRWGGAYCRAGRVAYVPTVTEMQGPVSCAAASIKCLSSEWKSGSFLMASTASYHC